MEYAQYFGTESIAIYIKVFQIQSIQLEKGVRNGSVPRLCCYLKKLEQKYDFTKKRPKTSFSIFFGIYFLAFGNFLEGESIKI